MNIRDRRSHIVHKFKTWNELKPGQVFVDIKETDYLTYYMKADSYFTPTQCYIDLRDGTLHTYLGSGNNPQYKVVTAEMEVFDSD